MPVYSFITTISAPDLDAAKEAAAEMTISLDEAVNAGDIPEGVTVERGELVENNLFGYLDLSTGHLSERTRDLLERAAGDLSASRGTLDGWPAMSIGAYAHGFFVTVPEKNEQDLSGLPEDLAGVMRYAQGLGVPLLRFDSDADYSAALPFYEES